MQRVRRYSDELRAQEAAGALRAHGIPAEVVGHHTQPLMSVGVLGVAWTGYDVVVLAKEDRGRAEAVLVELEGTKPVLEEGWEDEASRVDLSELDEEEYGVSCPACGEWLALKTELESCPGCGDDVDVVELVVRRHGPEVLAGEGGEVMDRVERMNRLIAARSAAGERSRCEECGCDLGGMPVRGRCPECGRLFDKDEMRGGRV